MSRGSIYIVAILSSAVWILLAWDHFHGGVPGHHILADENLPKISNWWGAILLPLLSWYLLYRVQRRAGDKNKDNPGNERFLLQALYRFASAMLFGILLSAFFTLGYSEISGYMILGLLPLALIFPLFRAEFLLGFVVGMTFTFGVVIPTIVGIILSFVGAILYLYIRTGFLFAGGKLIFLLGGKRLIDKKK